MEIAQLLTEELKNPFKYKNEAVIKNVMEHQRF